MIDPNFKVQVARRDLAKCSNPEVLTRDDASFNVSLISRLGVLQGEVIPIPTIPRCLSTMRQIEPVSTMMKGERTILFSLLGLREPDVV